MSINTNSALIYTNNILLPIVASDDAISVSPTYETIGLTTQFGTSCTCNKPITTTVKIKVLRGGDNSGNGFMSSAVVPLAVRELILSGQKIILRYELNDGSLRVTDTARAVRDEFKSYSSTEMMLTFMVDNPYKWSSLSNT